MPFSTSIPKIGWFFKADRKSTRLNSSHVRISYAVFCLKKKIVDRRVPGDARPLPVDQLHRIAKPAIAMDQFAHGRALGAVRATIDRRILARLLSGPDPI